MSSCLVGAVVAAVIVIVLFGPKELYRDDEPPLTAVVRPAPVPVVSYADALVPDVPVQPCAEDAEVRAFAESIAGDLLLEFEVDGWRRSA